MRPRSAPPLVALALLTGLAAAPARPRGDPHATAADRVVPNDNRRPAGTRRDGVLALRLEARLAAWHPDGDDAPGATVPAFAEEGGVARIPGPLLRVPAGTRVALSLRNALGDTLRVQGLHTRGGGAAVDTAPVTLPPGTSRTTRFRLHTPGTYYYWGTTTRRAIDYRTLDDAQLTGAIVVDAAPARATTPPPDRVFVIGMWADTVHRARTHRRRLLAVINGRSWPHTERLSYAVGDTVRWRVVNASADLHPMHLHGFYFRIDGRGDGATDTTYAPGRKELAVTESMGAGSTLSLTWVPERPGNWLFHCHIPEHFAPRGSLGLARPAASAAAHADHAVGGMNGLVLGVTVRPASAAPPAVGVAAGAERHLRLLVRPNRGGSHAAPLYGYALHEPAHGAAEPPPDSGLSVGPTLALERGRQVRISVVNRLPEPTAVHWHGIELESYFDGVPGFSGAGRRVTPLIAPGDSFEVRFTPPRAGTFIYHTHAEEERQQLAGLAGAIVVHEPGAPRPATDIPLLLTEAANASGRPVHVLVNGHPAPRPLELVAGTTYRLRFIQIAVSRSALRLELLRDSTLATWHPVAKDGADLAAHARTPVPAHVRLGIGEAYDVEVTPDRAGDMRLEVRAGIRGTAPAPLLVTLPIRVVAVAQR